MYIYTNICIYVYIHICIYVYIYIGSGSSDVEPSFLWQVHILKSQPFSKVYLTKIERESMYMYIHMNTCRYILL